MRRAARVGQWNKTRMNTENKNGARMEHSLSVAAVFGTGSVQVQLACARKTAALCPFFLWPAERAKVNSIALLIT